MLIARFTTDSDPKFAIVSGEGEDRKLEVIDGDPLYMPVQPTGEAISLNDDAVRLLTPVIPRSKVVGVGRNYADHAAEHGAQVPAEPLLFLKPNTAVIGPDDPILLPAWTNHVEHEVELAVVIGKITRDVSEEDALKHVFGYTVANDVTARDAQQNDGQWTRAKGFDSALPLGPFISVGTSPDSLDLFARVNGEQKQAGNTDQLVFGVAELVSYISSVFTLLPGDVILTGTPAGVSPIEHRDVVECEISGIGVLRNPVLRRN